MSIRLCSYNIMKFDRLFKKNNELREEEEKRDRLKAIGKVLQTIDADIIGVIEAPDTTKDKKQSTVKKLENFATYAEIRANKCLHGFISRTRQELAILYDSTRLEITHVKGGNPKKVMNPPFDKMFMFDTDEDRIREIYIFARPPLEAEVKVLETNTLFRLMVVHPKSKGIFNAMDMAHFERESQRNRRKLFGECTWIRRRVDEWLDEGHQVVVMGDINDGPGMDFYEYQFGRSATEIVMGDIFEPRRLLRSCVGRPTWSVSGWKPASSDFKDVFTGRKVRVLIDHILFSQGMKVDTSAKESDGYPPGRIWNPDSDSHKAYHVDAPGIKDELQTASDHFPVTLDLA